MMKIQKSRIEQLNEIMSLYSGARLFMKQHRNPDQWGEHYPEESMIRMDIEAGNSYVCIENEQIQAVFFYKMGQDFSYKKIYDGKWRNESPYGVVHRLASKTTQKGCASFCLSWALEQCGNLKIDTHRDNKVMQNLLKKNGFSYCGIICLNDGSERLAYQKSM